MIIKVVFEHVNGDLQRIGVFDSQAELEQINLYKAKNWKIKTVDTYPDDDPEGKVELFRHLVDRHDITYAFSDDHRVWSNGVAQLDRIRQLAKEIGPELAKEIWNANIDLKYSHSPHAREQFGWK